MFALGDETWDGTWPFTPHYSTTRGIGLPAVDAGQGAPSVLVHETPTWGYLYRQFIAPLARSRHCIVPDHMGGGKSSVSPTPYPYLLQHHLMMHTWACVPWPGGPLPRLLAMIRSARGEKFVPECNGYVAPALQGTTYHVEHLTDTVMATYRAPFPTPASRLALLSWSRDLPLQDADLSYATMQRLAQGLWQCASLPILLVWGQCDPVLGEPVLPLWPQTLPQARTHMVEGASHSVPEDAPERAVGWIEALLAAHACKVMQSGLALWRKKGYNTQPKRDLHSRTVRSARVGGAIMALRRLNIDFEALARAMAKQGSDEYDYYLDTTTGRVMRIATEVWNALEEGETIAGSLNAWQQEELHEAQAVFSDTQGRYLPIPEGMAWDIEEVMPDFVESVRDADLRSKLSSAMASRNAARRFRDILVHYPDEQQRWLALQQQSQRAHAAQWLEDEGIEPVWIMPSKP